MEQEPKPISILTKITSYAILFVCLYGIQTIREAILNSKKPEEREQRKTNKKKLKTKISSLESEISEDNYEESEEGEIRTIQENRSERLRGRNQISKLSVSTKLLTRGRGTMSVKSGKDSRDTKKIKKDKIYKMNTHRNQSNNLSVSGKRRPSFISSDFEEKMQESNTTTDFLKNTKLGFTNDSILSNLKDMTVNRSNTRERSALSNSMDNSNFHTKFGKFFKRKFFGFFEGLNIEQKQKFILENPMSGDTKFCDVDESEAFYRSRMISDLEIDLKLMVPRIMNSGKDNHQCILGYQKMKFEMKIAPELPIYLEYSGDVVLMLRVNGHYQKHGSIYWSHNKLEITEGISKGENEVEILFGSSIDVSGEMEESLVFKNLETNVSIFPTFSQENMRIAKFRFECLIPEKNQDLKFNTKVSDEKILDVYETDPTLEIFKDCFKISIQGEVKSLNYSENELQNFLFFFASNSDIKQDEDDYREFTILTFNTLRNCTNGEICFYLNYDFESLELFETVKIEDYGKTKVIEFFKRDDINYQEEKMEFLVDLIKEFFKETYSLMELEITLNQFSVIIDEFSSRDQFVSNEGNMVFVKEILVKKHIHQISLNDDHLIYISPENLMIKIAHEVFRSFSGVIFGLLVTKKNKYDDFLIKGLKGYLSMKLLQLSSTLESHLKGYCKKKVSMAAKVFSKTPSNVTYNSNLLNDLNDEDDENNQGQNDYKIDVFDDQDSASEEVESLEINELLLVYINLMREEIIEFDSSMQAQPLRHQHNQEEDSLKREVPDNIKELKFYFLLNQLEIPYKDIFKSLGDLMKAYLYESINLDDFLSFITENLQIEEESHSLNSEVRSEIMDNDEKTVLRGKFLNSIFESGLNTISIEISKSKKSSKIEFFKLIQKDHCHLNTNDPVLRNQKFTIKLFNSVAEVTNIEEIQMKTGYEVKQVNEFYQKKIPKAVIMNSDFRRLIIEELDCKTLAFFTEYFSYIKDINDKLLFIHYLNRHSLYQELLKVSILAIKFEENSNLLVYIIELSGKILNSVFGGFSKFGTDYGNIKEEKADNELLGAGLKNKKKMRKHRRARSRCSNDITMNDSRNKIFLAILDRLKEEQSEEMKMSIVSVISPIIDQTIAKMYIVDQEWRFSSKVGQSVIKILTDLMNLKLVIYQDASSKEIKSGFKKMKRAHSLEINPIGNHPFTTIQRLEKNINLVDFEKSSTILQKVKYRKELKHENYIEYFESLYKFIKSSPPIDQIDIFFPLIIVEKNKFTTCVSEICDILDQEKFEKYSTRLRMLTEELIKRLDIASQIRDEIN